MHETTATWSPMTSISDPSVPTAGWPVGATSRTVDLGAEVRYWDFGGPDAGSPLVCVHGLGGSALNFGCLGPLLAPTHRVLALDLLGHGGSGVLEDAGGDAREDVVLDQVRMLARFVEEVAGGPAVLVGHSLGGIIAALLTAERPDLVDRLVLIGPPVPGAAAGRRDRRLASRLAFLRAPGVGALVRRTMRRASPEELVRRQLADATPHADAVPAEAVRASIEETAGRASRPDTEAARRSQWHAILGTLALLVRAGAWRSRLDGIAAPVLWLHGVDDLLSAVADGEALAAGRGWEFRSRAGVGHLPHLEDAAWTAAQVSGWLSDDGTRGGARG